MRDIAPTGKIDSTGEPPRYGAVAILFHWIIAAAVTAAVIIGWQMVPLALSPRKVELYALHKSIGITVLALVLLRLLWRLTHRPPPLPAGLPAWQRIIATATHHSLYLLLLILPLSGWLLNSVVGFPLSWFGLVTLPPLASATPGAKEIADTAHILLGWLMIGLVGLHAAAALHHQFILRDGILMRMLPRFIPSFPRERP